MQKYTLLYTLNEFLSYCDETNIQRLLIEISSSNLTKFNQDFFNQIDSLIEPYTIELFIKELEKWFRLFKVQSYKINKECLSFIMKCKHLKNKVSQLYYIDKEYIGRCPYNYFIVCKCNKDIENFFSFFKIRETLENQIKQEKENYYERISYTNKSGFIDLSLYDQSNPDSKHDIDRKKMKHLRKYAQLNQRKRY